MGYGRAQRIIETAGLGAWIGLALAASWPLSGSLASEWPARAAIALLALVVADFLSGLAHWACDTWGSVDLPWIGNGVIRGFREHHVDPTAITRHDFVETNGAVTLATLPLLVLALSRGSASPGERLATTFLVCLAGWLLLTNQIHLWAHHPRPPAAVRALQRRGLILSPRRHALHHRSPFDRDYCITTGWLNSPLAAIGFFPAIEDCVMRLTGAIPRRHDRGAVADDGRLRKPRSSAA